MGNKILYTLLDYRNEYIENIETKEQVARNSLSVSDTSLNENIILWQDFAISEDENKLKSLKNFKDKLFYINDKCNGINKW